MTFLIRHGLGDPDELIKIIEFSQNSWQHEDPVLVVPGDVQLVYLLKQRLFLGSTLMLLES